MVVEGLEVDGAVEDEPVARTGGERPLQEGDGLVVLVQHEGDPGRPEEVLRRGVLGVCQLVQVSPPV